MNKRVLLDPVRLYRFYNYLHLSSLIVVSFHSQVPKLTNIVTNCPPHRHHSKIDLTQIIISAEG